MQLFEIDKRNSHEMTLDETGLLHPLQAGRGFGVAAALSRLVSRSRIIAAGPYTKKV